MPKPFMLGVEVEEIALGKIMRVLNNLPGVVKLHMNLSPKKKQHAHAFNGKATRKGRFDKSGERVILELLNKSPTHRNVMAQHFAEAGRSRTSINSCIHKLKTAKLITLNAKHEWQNTAKGRAAFLANHNKD